MQDNTDAAIAYMLLGCEAVQELYGCAAASAEEELCALPFKSHVFLLRLRTLLKFACANLGLETVCRKLQLPAKIASYIKTGSADPQPEVRKRTDTPPVEEKRDSGELTITEDQKRTAVSLYNKGVKLQYIAGLFGIVNPSVLHSWGDWQRLSRAEALKKLEKRKAILDRLGRGENPQSIRVALRIKDRVYRDLMGTPIGVLFPYSAYETVTKQMAVVNFGKVVSRNTGVPMYFIRRWMDGLDIPQRPLLENDEDGAADKKWLAIAKYYETGSAMVAADTIGATNPQIVERWVTKYQKKVDERGVMELPEESR